MSERGHRKYSRARAAAELSDRENLHSRLRLREFRDGGTPSLPFVIFVAFCMNLIRQGRTARLACRRAPEICKLESIRFTQRVNLPSSTPLLFAWLACFAVSISESKLNQGRRARRPSPSFSSLPSV